MRPEQILGEQLITAALDGDVARVTSLLDQGANVNSTTTDGTTALIIAAQHGHEEIVDVLLERGANINLSRTYGWTSLIIAAQNGHAGVVSTLLDRGTVVSSTLLDGTTALMSAARYGHEEIVNEIITNTILSQRNRGADWREMAYGNPETNQPSQLVNRDQERVLNFLSRKTATLLSIVIDNESLRNTVVENFNQRNVGNPLDQADESKITKLRMLRSKLEEEFLCSIKAKKGLSRFSAENTIDRNQAESLAIIAVVNFLTNPSQLADFKNYLEARDKGNAVNITLDIATELSIDYLTHNPRLSDSQNFIVHQALRDLIAPHLRRDLDAVASAVGGESSPPAMTLHIQRFGDSASSAATVVPPLPPSAAVTSANTQLFPPNTIERPR